MALINCPECNRRISDKAKSCPGCGYTLQEQAATLSDFLVGQRWLVRSGTLGDGRILDAAFSQDGSFNGMLTAPPDDFFVKTQQVNGNWHAAGSLLSIQWDWVQSSGPYHEEVPIEISDASADKLVGVDKWFRLWELARTENQ